MITIALLMLLVGAPTSAAPRRQLRVCADPNNLPFSDQKEQGFENALAQLIARELDADVTYTWFPQRRGFFKNTLKAKLCDVVMGVLKGLDFVATTAPYYRSGYVFVYGPKAPHVTSLEDPRLASLRIGVPLVGDDGANPPPVLALARHGHSANVRGYLVYGDYSKPAPAADLIRAVSRGEVDLAIAWGPLAGYFAKHAEPQLELAPVPESEAPPGQTFAFELSLGVRREDLALKAELEAVLQKKRDEIDSLLTSYGVPLR